MAATWGLLLQGYLLIKCQEKRLEGWMGECCSLMTMISFGYHHVLWIICITLATETALCYGHALLTIHNKAASLKAIYLYD